MQHAKVALPCVTALLRARPDQTTDKCHTSLADTISRTDPRLARRQVLRIKMATDSGIGTCRHNRAHESCPNKTSTATQHQGKHVYTC